MRSDVAEVLIDRQRIAQRVRELAGQITRDLCGSDDPQVTDRWQITLVPVLTGSLIFVADLMRQLPLRMRIRLVSVSSYPGQATQSQGAQLEKMLTRLPEDLSGQHVLVIDDILDSGRTLRLVRQVLEERHPAGLRTCVLLRKDRPEARALSVDYVGFDIPDRFVVGYGLDYNDYYRNLPDIVTLRPEAMQAHG